MLYFDVRNMFIPGPMSMCIGSEDEVEVGIEPIECAIDMAIEAIEGIEVIEDIESIFMLTSVGFR